MIEGGRPRLGQTQLIEMLPFVDQVTCRTPRDVCTLRLSLKMVIIERENSETLAETTQ